MNIILEKNVEYKSKIKDFGVDPINKKVITVGEKLLFVKDGLIVKEVSGKAKNSELIKYIKETNQLFISSNFFLSTLNGKVLKCDSLKQKITEVVFDKDKIMDYLNFTTSGKIIYVEKNILFSYDPVMKETISSDCLIKEMNIKGNYKIFISGENIILKYREIHNQSNIIAIFNEKLEKIFEIKTEKNHIYSKIDGLLYVAGTSDGEIEIWDIIEKEMYNSIKISEHKITYIEKYDNNYFIGTANGEIIIVDNKFKKLNNVNVVKGEIDKICVVENKLFVLGENQILEYKILGKNSKNEKEYIENFLKKYKIHSDYEEFFTINKVIKIENFIKDMEIKNINYTPKKDKIFRALGSKINSRKVCILGKDPYFQEGVATGLAFEVDKESWDDPEVNTSLKNILKLIYKTYVGKLEDISTIRNEINNNKFSILSPNKLFESWNEQGVLLLNTALTTVVGKAGEHHVFWDKIIRELIQYISTKNNNIIYFLWGKDAEIFEKEIMSGDIIKHNHPAICGNLSNEKDFLNGKSFENTAHMINWTGYEQKAVEKPKKEGKLF